MLNEKLIDIRYESSMAHPNMKKRIKANIPACLYRGVDFCLLRLLLSRSENVLM